MSTLLELRNKLKNKKPTFIRHDAHKKKRVSAVWRRPKGRQNKMRLHKKGYARGRSTGFGSPVAVRGLSRTGLRQINVATLKEFEGLDPKVDGIIIARTVGNRKRVMLIEHAQKNKFTILNFNGENVLAKINDQQVAKVSRKKVLLKKQKEKEQSAKKKEEAKAKAKVKETEKSSEKTVSAESEKIQEKKEHDKILTKKGGQL